MQPLQTDDIYPHDLTRTSSGRVYYRFQYPSSLEGVVHAGDRRSIASHDVDVRPRPRAVGGLWVRSGRLGNHRSEQHGVAVGAKFDSSQTTPWIMRFGVAPKARDFQAVKSTATHAPICGNTLDLGRPNCAKTNAATTEQGHKERRAGPQWRPDSQLLLRICLPTPIRISLFANLICVVGVSLFVERLPTRRTIGIPTRRNVDG